MAKFIETKRPPKRFRHKLEIKDTENDFLTWASGALIGTVYWSRTDFRNKAVNTYANYWPSRKKNFTGDTIPVYTIWLTDDADAVHVRLTWPS